MARKSWPNRTFKHCAFPRIGERDRNSSIGSGTLIKVIGHPNPFFSVLLPVEPFWFCKMIDLLLVLTVIALLDCMSMVPLAVLPMTVALGSSRPLALAGAFIAGIYAAYFACGIPLWLGAEVFIEHFGAYLSRLWNQPNALELVIQIVLGVLLMLSAWYLHRSKKNKTESGAKPMASPGAMFLLGVTLILIGIPGAVPYLAAIERIVSQDLNWAGAVACLGFYNLIFVLPFLCLIGFRFAMPQHAGKLFQTLADFCLSMMPKLTALLFFLVGLVMAADGVGWFLGHPLLPVSSLFIRSA